MQKVMINETVVRVIKKNANEEVRVSVGWFGGYKIVNVRVWYRDGDTFRPSQKGVAFRMETLDQIRDALAEAREIDVPTLPE